MPVVDVSIDRREPYADGQEFGEAGAYERIDGILTFAVNPFHEANNMIVDIDRAARDEWGRVRFQGDFCLLQPADPEKANRRALVELPNRGRKLIPRHFNRAEPEVPPTANIPEGDGFLFRHGYTVAWIGWQWDVNRSDALMGLGETVALWNWKQIQGQNIVEIHPNIEERTRLLANRIHRPYPVADLEDPEAVLYVRDYEDGEPEIIPRDQWRFAREEGREVVPSNQHIYLESGFQPGRIYHVVYTAVGAPVVGAGLLAARDVASFIRYDAYMNPAAGRIDRVYSFGMSQSGRMQRHFLYLGLNVDEQERPAYDGMLVHVAGARRGEFNHRFAQPSVQPTPGFGHLPPFSDDAVAGPDGEIQEGLLSQQRERGQVPKIFYINTSAEYWRGDCSLLHIDPTGSTDLDPAPESRIYLFASTQHGPGSVPQTNYNPNDGSRGRYPFNAVEYTPLLRAALVNMDNWVSRNVQPPPSRHPRLDDGTAVSREQVLNRFTDFPDMHLPDFDRLPVLREVDLGPEWKEGIGRYPVTEGAAYPCFVSAVDDDGNEIAGIRLPDLTVPLGTHTGWNPRDPSTGAPEQIMPMQGFSRWFAQTARTRESAGDPRPAIEERYQDRNDFLERVRAAAEELVREGYALEEDVDVIVHDAARRLEYLAGS